ncbi:TPA_asm: phosphatidylserine/phosphatidylglycerophosphate/cardiolipin synthase family protein, partial [Listeria monocytogenes]|nr:phosphatidylserine/phosphatidylglycerophosphate/cardiolipin synthase family protein [Listeria monocytogenes]
MDISFNGGRFVSLKNGLNYQEILNDFSNAKLVRVVTFNISKNEKYDDLMKSLHTLQDDVDVQLITNIPSHFDVYYNSPAGESMRRNFKNNCEIYLRKLDPEKFDSKAMSFFNFNNHAKIVGTENIVYIGSANFSNESKNNIESGIIIEDKEFIQKLYHEFFEEIKESSLPYYDDDYMVLRLLVISLLTKFRMHYQKLNELMYFENPRSGKTEFISKCTYLSEDDLLDIHYDLQLFQDIEVMAENTYTEEDDEYNDSMEHIVQLCNSMNLNWLVDITGVDDILYNYVRFDFDSVCNDCLEEYASEAYDEYLEGYVEKAMDDATNIENEMLQEVDQISDEFYFGIT